MDRLLKIEQVSGPGAVEYVLRRIEMAVESMLMHGLNVHQELAMIEQVCSFLGEDE